MIDGVSLHSPKDDVEVTGVKDTLLTPSCHVTTPTGVQRSEMV